MTKVTINHLVNGMTTPLLFGWYGCLGLGNPWCPQLFFWVDRGLHIKSQPHHTHSPSNSHSPWKMLWKGNFRLQLWCFSLLKITDWKIKLFDWSCQQEGLTGHCHANFVAGIGVGCERSEPSQAGQGPSPKILAISSSQVWAKNLKQLLARWFPQLVPGKGTLMRSFHMDDGPPQGWSLWPTPLALRKGPPVGCCSWYLEAPERPSNPYLRLVLASIFRGGPVSLGVVSPRHCRHCVGRPALKWGRARIEHSTRTIEKVCQFFPAPSPRVSESVPTSSAITWVGIGWLEGVSCFKKWWFATA